MAGVRLAIAFLQKVSVETLSDTELDRVKESVETIKISCAHNDGNVAATQETVRYLSDMGLATILLRIMQSLKSRISSKTWPCLQAIRSVCIDLSARFDSFCADLCSAGFVKVLIHELKLYQKTTLAQNVR